jgi:hypothetical protein
METESSLPCPQEPVTGPWPEPNYLAQCEATPIVS